MPLCNEHGQVYGEGGQCIVCAGGEPHHEAENVPTMVSQTQRDLYEEALETLNQKIADLEERVAKLE
jgi:hypothetical protein